MTREDFLDLVRSDLKLRHAPFHHGHLREFFEGMWPLVEPEDLPSGWADAFLEVEGREPGLCDLGRAPVAGLYEAGGN